MTVDVIERKTYQPGDHPLVVETKADKGIVVALPAVTANVDEGGDIIEPGAFAISRNPYVLVGHQKVQQSLVGAVTSWEELRPGDPRLPADLQAKGYGGLRVEAQFNMAKQIAVETFSDLQLHGALGWSIGYQVLDVRPPTDDEKAQGALRVITKLDIVEVSPVLFGMNPEARTLAAKASTATRFATAAMAAQAIDGLAKALRLDAPPDEEMLEWAKAIARQDAIPEEVQGEMRAYFERHAGAAKTAPEGSAARVRWQLWGGNAGAEWVKAAVGEKQALSGSFEDVGARVRAAVSAIYTNEEAGRWSWVEATFADSVVFCVEGEGELRTWKAPYTVEAVGTITLGDPVEVSISAVEKAQPKADEPDVEEPEDEPDEDDEAAEETEPVEPMTDEEAEAEAELETIAS